MFTKDILDHTSQCGSNFEEFEIYLRKSLDTLTFLSHLSNDYNDVYKLTMTSPGSPRLLKSQITFVTYILSALQQRNISTTHVSTVHIIDLIVNAQMHVIQLTKRTVLERDDSASNGGEPLNEQAKKDIARTWGEWFTNNK